MKIASWCRANAMPLIAVLAAAVTVRLRVALPGLSRA